MPSDNSSSSKNNFLVQGSILAAASILVRVIGLLYRIPMTRIIGNEGMGYYENAFEVYNLCFIISSYAMPTAVSKLIAQRSTKKQYRNSIHLFVTALAIAILLGGSLAVAVYFGAAFISSSILGNPNTQIPLRVLAPTILISAVLGVFRGFFQGKGTMVPTALSQLLEQIVNAFVSVFASLYLVRTHSASEQIAAFGAAGGTAGTGIGAFFGLVLLVFIFVVNMPVFRRQMRRDQTEHEEGIADLILILIYTIVPVMLSQVLVRSNGIIAIALFNHILAGKGMSEEAYNSLYGIYSAKYLVLTNIVIGITSAITMAMIPAIVSAHAIGSMTEVRRKISLAVKFNLIIAMPSCVGLMILGGPIIRVLFGDTDPMIALVMLVGSISVVLYTMSILFNTIIQSIHHMRIPVINSAIAILLDIPVLWILLKFTDLNVFALVIGNLVMPVVVIILDSIVLYKDLAIRIDLKKSVLTPALASLIMGVLVYVVYFLTSKLPYGYLIGTILGVLIGVLSFFAAELLLKGITEDELYSFPKGSLIIQIAKKMHLL